MSLEAVNQFPEARMQEDAKHNDEEKLDADSSSQIQDESSSPENSDGHTPGMRKLTVNRQPS